MRGSVNVGLVLGAGGTVGHAYHAGTLAGLAEAGWDARRAGLIIGTSIGALTGALLRAGLSPADMYARVVGDPLSAEGRSILEEVEGWWEFSCDMPRGRTPLGRPASLRLMAHLARRPWRTRAGLLLAALTPGGSVSTGALADELDRVLGGAWPEPPLWVCALDLDTGERVVLGPPGGPAVGVGTAVAASSAVPAVFEPVTVEGHRLVDGGLHSPANADVLMDAIEDLDAVVASVPMGVEADPGRLGVDLPGRFLNHWTTSRELAPVRRAGVEATVFEPGRSELELMHYDAFDLTHRAAIARRAYETARARLAAQVGIAP
jgi:NTE family protein